MASGSLGSLSLRLGWVAALLHGCTCQSESDVQFPDVPNPDEDPASEENAPTSYGSWLSFDRSPEGERLTMSYYDKDRGALGYAVGTPDADGVVKWRHERVVGYPDDAGVDATDAGKYSSQKTAPDGTVWIAYQNSSTGALQVSHRTGPDTWAEPEVVDGGTSQPGVGHWASLALDSAGNPVVAHCDEANAAVRLSRRVGGSWSTAQVYASVPRDETDTYGVVTTIPANVGYTALVIAGDQEILAFLDGAKGELHVMRGTGGDLTDEVVDTGGVGAWPSIHAEGGDVWVAYQDVANEALKFASNSGSGWATMTIDDEELHGADTAIFARGGEPAIVYFDGMNNDVWLATRTGAGWNHEKLGGDEGAVGFHNEVVTIGDRVYAGSYDYTADTLYLKAM